MSPGDNVVLRFLPADAPTTTVSHAVLGVGTPYECVVVVTMPLIIRPVIKGAYEDIMAAVSQGGAAGGMVRVDRCGSRIVYNRQVSVSESQSDETYATHVFVGSNTANITSHTTRFARRSSRPSRRSRPSQTQTRRAQTLPSMCHPSPPRVAYMDLPTPQVAKKGPTTVARRRAR